MGKDDRQSAREHMLNEIKTNRDLLKEIRENQRILIDDDLRRDRLDYWVRVGVCAAVLIALLALFK